VHKNHDASELGEVPLLFETVTNAVNNDNDIPTSIVMAFSSSFGVG